MSKSTNTAGVTPAPDLTTLLAALDHATPKFPLIATVMPQLHEALTKKILGGASYRVLAKALVDVGLVVTAPELERVHRAAVDRNARRKIANKLKAKSAVEAKAKDTPAKIKKQKDAATSPRSGASIELQKVIKVKMPANGLPDHLRSALFAAGFLVSKYAKDELYDRLHAGLALSSTLIDELKTAGAIVVLYRAKPTT
ncbi:hypothetical protein J8J14_23400 [Roseomonas sp. SSH11]|uniref:Uncharacterized protein n=1 Tax=Pararoseomonas baculiformis TaxID=2820812 RepID=A0ABS4AL02_9PROT|nr:hypothetical protein [Pararoseomonas baculiformis]MBP0447702.1 hypothetical protein [Pararoseomonas baculiformis]